MVLCLLVAGDDLSLAWEIAVRYRRILVVGLVALRRLRILVESVVDVLAVQDRVTELSGYDRSGQVGFDTILDEGHVEDRVYGRPPRRNDLEGIRNKFAKLRREAGGHWRVGSPHNLHGQHVQAWGIKRRPEGAHFVEHDPH